MPKRLETWLISAIAAHSLAIGLALLLLGQWGLRLGGWSDVTPLFFARQAGAFHVVVAIGYYLEFRRYGSIYLILIAKGAAVLFLSGALLEGGTPWTVPVSAVGDGLMGLSALAVHWLAHTQATDD